MEYSRTHTFTPKMLSHKSCSQELYKGTQHENMRYCQMLWISDSGCDLSGSFIDAQRLPFDLHTILKRHAGTDQW